MSAAAAASFNDVTTYSVAPAELHTATAALSYGATHTFTRRQPSLNMLMCSRDLAPSSLWERAWKWAEDLIINNAEAKKEDRSDFCC